LEGGLKISLLQLKNAEESSSLLESVGELSLLPLEGVELQNALPAQKQ